MQAFAGIWDELRQCATTRAGSSSGLAPAPISTIKKEPNRFRGLYGGARAAEAAGQRARAIALYKQLLQVASDADTNRPELQHARNVIK